jgi:hypothetical protein
MPKKTSRRKSWEERYKATKSGWDIPLEFDTLLIPKDEFTVKFPSVSLTIKVQRSTSCKSAKPAEHRRSSR